MGIVSLNEHRLIIIINSAAKFARNFLHKTNQNKPGTLWHEKAIRIIGLLWGQSIGDWSIHITKELWCWATTESQWCQKHFHAMMSSYTSSIIIVKYSRKNPGIGRELWSMLPGWLPLNKLTQVWWRIIKEHNVNSRLGWTYTSPHRWNRTLKTNISK